MRLVPEVSEFPFLVFNKSQWLQTKDSTSTCSQIPDDQIHNRQLKQVLSNAILFNAWPNPMGIEDSQIASGCSSPFFTSVLKNAQKWWKHLQEEDDLQSFMQPMVAKIVRNEREEERQPECLVLSSTWLVTTAIF